MDKYDKMLEESSQLLLVLNEFCQGFSFGAIIAALTGVMAKVLYHLPVESREKILVDFDKSIRTAIEHVPELEEALEKDGKQSDS